MSKPRYFVISYLDIWCIPTRTKKKIEECKQYFGHVVIWDSSKAKVVASTPYNVYSIDPMQKVAREHNIIQADRELYIKEVIEYAGR